mmetsp:Transcript_12208/g.26033  ORF Transcript_12208/g.26033 Transcript_12208/m.26033 type:complete len:155 (+) Transcript_12208:43-507(+)
MKCTSAFGSPEVQGRTQQPSTSSHPLSSGMKPDSLARSVIRRSSCTKPSTRFAGTDEDEAEEKETEDEEEEGVSPAARSRTGPGLQPPGRPPFTVVAWVDLLLARIARLEPTTTPFVITILSSGHDRSDRVQCGAGVQKRGDIACTRARVGSFK